MADSLLQQALEVACRAADSARAIVLGRYRGSFSVTAKADQSPVTEADREAELAIRKVIGDAFPDHALLGEEYGGQSVPERLGWLVDPIDGTRSFMYRIPLFATLIAFCRGSDPLVAVVDFPALDRRFTAITGEGAWEGQRRLNVDDGFDPQASLVCHGDLFQFETAGRVDLYRAVERQTKLFRSYTDAFGHAMVACGSAALMVDPDLKPWDIAAPSLLVREAGGRVALESDPRDASHVLAISGCPAAVDWIEGLRRTMEGAHKP